MALQVVWFKRDLRLADHAALHSAHAQNQPVLHLFLFEPIFKAHPNWSLRHWQAQYQSALEVQHQLAQKGQVMLILHGSAADVFSDLAEKLPLAKVHSYQETDVEVSFERDLTLQKFFRKQAILWQEHPANGVFRGLKNRQKWDERWRDFMSQPLAKVIYSKATLDQSDWLEHLQRKFALPAKIKQQLENYPAAFQKVGEAEGQKQLQHFLNGHYQNYSKHISKPLQSRTSCSRLSVFLAWGNLSLRQVYQASRKAYLKSTSKRNLKNFISRLHWHSHFIQKFEMEHRMEQETINRGFEALHQAADEERIEAWKKGETGYPLVDASMKALHETGYLNFRMRAMLVSFFCHHLWQPWQAGAHYLAQQFLDFIPGIHYPQFQMQAGLTGINTVRVYNPEKQAEEHDPHGEFICTYLPALQKIPAPLRATPWALSPLEQSFYDFTPGKDYPLPIVDAQKQAAKAREILHEAKKWPRVKQESLRILQRHTTAIRNTESRTQTVLSQKR